ncbi:MULTISPECIES: hypothetical protein [unclassified Okeania]|uniref:hypothetical protein n=1 Tax=unclassified Okeania TaxID=2634635 RepID=UPI0033907734
MWVVDSKARSITVFLYSDAVPQTYIGNPLFRNSLFEGLELTAGEVLIRGEFPLKLLPVTGKKDEYKICCKLSLLTLDCHQNITI